MAELFSEAKMLATLNTDRGKQNKQYAKTPRRKFITAATKEYKYASYMESWRKKVEKVGNLNFPQAAKARNLAGSLILDIAINVDGTIRSYKIARSSGHKILDDAALNIVHLAAPFAPLPPDIRKETDVLHITRTWKFLDSDRLTTR
ncbi:MAG TPA: energy transducer TonB [Gammaproteobacteria bacterium]|nr:energy transducer TonB [Gammaproteobacteria bacterium]